MVSCFKFTGGIFKLHKVDYDNFEKVIGYEFKNINLLIDALTHSSYANECKNGKVIYNERMEFLGDAVLELVSSDFIYNTMNLSEGKMSKLRASMVCEPTLSLCAKEIGLDSYIRLGKGEEKTGGRKRESIISDAFESLIAAIYLDSGIEAAREFILKFVLNDYENKKLFVDSKTILQEVIARDGRVCEYEIISQSGPSHDCTFEARVISNGLFEAKGYGPNKKKAEQDAAYNALLILKKKGIDIKI